MWNCWFSTRTSLRSSWRTSTTISTASSWTIIAAKFGITWSSSYKSHRNGRIKEVSDFHLRQFCKKKISREARHYLETYWPNTRFAKWNNCMSDSKVEGCWISSQWKFSRYQSTSVIPTHGISGNVFCKSRCVIISTFSSRIASVELINHHRHRSAPRMFHLLWFWAFLETMDSWLGKLGVNFLRIWSWSMQRLCLILLVVFRCK